MVSGDLEDTAVIRTIDHGYLEEHVLRWVRSLPAMITATILTFAGGVYGGGPVAEAKEVSKATTDDVPSVASYNSGSWDLGSSNMIDLGYQDRNLNADLERVGSLSSRESFRVKIGDHGDDKYHDDGFKLDPSDAVKIREDSQHLNPVGFDDGHPTGDSGNGYSKGQCTWWAYVRRHELGLPAGTLMGNGGEWGSTARRMGYWVDSNPQPGDVMVFKPGQAGSDGYYGHVAVVESVLDVDGFKYVVTSESGMGFGGKTVSRIIGDTGRFDFIHY